jgi:hypothetical protein
MLRPYNKKNKIWDGVVSSLNPPKTKKSGFLVNFSVNSHNLFKQPDFWGKGAIAS